MDRNCAFLISIIDHLKRIFHIYIINQNNPFFPLLIRNFFLENPVKHTGSPNRIVRRISYISYRQSKENFSWIIIFLFFLSFSQRIRLSTQVQPVELCVSYVSYRSSKENFSWIIIFLFFLSFSQRIRLSTQVHPMELCVSYVSYRSSEENFSRIILYVYIYI